jgi:hypothetical protein
MPTGIVALQLLTVSPQRSEKLNRNGSNDTKILLTFQAGVLRSAHLRQVTGNRNGLSTRPNHYAFAELE